MYVFFFLVGVIFFVLIIGTVLYDLLFQRTNTVLSNFPLIGRLRYFFHTLRPFFRQYFGDDDSFVARNVIDWIKATTKGQKGYFSFDLFDTTGRIRDPDHQMIHATAPLNDDEMQPVYPLIGAQRTHPLQLRSYIYRSAMSLGSIAFEATWSMAKGCADVGAAFNTGEGGLSIHHLPNLAFGYDKKFLTYKKLPGRTKLIHTLLPGQRWKNRRLERCGNHYEPAKGERDLFLFDHEHRLFYKIDRDAPLEVFPRPEELDDSYGQLIFQVGSGLYGLRQMHEDGTWELDRDRFAKIMSFCRACEIKLAQGAKQTGGILIAEKNTPTVAEIRGVRPHVDLVSPNRFPYFDADDVGGFLDFVEQASTMAGGKPVGCKLVISDRSNIVPLAHAIKEQGIGPDFVTIDGGDGGSGTAPLALGILFGKPIYDAIAIVDEILREYGIRDRITLLGSSKLYAPHMSARAMALGADAIGNGRSIMIAGGCIRAGLCSGEHGVCPIGMATMDRSKRRGYEQTMKHKATQIGRYITAHNKGLIQVAAVVGVTSPHLLERKHVVVQPS